MASEIVECLQNLSFSSFSSNLIDQFCSGSAGEDSDCGPLDDFICNDIDSLHETFESGRNLIDRWRLAEAGSEGQDSLWEDLAGANVNCRALVALMSRIITSKSYSTPSSVLPPLEISHSLRLACSRFYISLLGVEGSLSFGVYSGHVLRSVFALMKTVLQNDVQDNASSSQTGEGEDQQPSQQPNSKKRKTSGGSSRGSSESSRRSRSSAGSTSDQHGDPSDIPLTELALLMREIRSLLASAPAIRNQPGIAQVLIEILTEMTRLHFASESVEGLPSTAASHPSHATSSKRKGSSKDNTTTISDECFEVLGYLCHQETFLENPNPEEENQNPKKKKKSSKKRKSITSNDDDHHQEGEGEGENENVEIVENNEKQRKGNTNNHSDIVAQVLHCLLPNVLGMNESGSKSKTSSRARALEFIKQTFLKTSQDLPSILVLLQHICVRAQDRSENRVIACDSVMKIWQNMESLHEKSEFANFVATLSRSAKPSNRAMAVDVAFAISQHCISSIEDEERSDEERDMFTRVSGDLFAVLVLRASDKAATVRSKALQCVSSVLEQEAHATSADTSRLDKSHLRDMLSMSVLGGGDASFAAANQSRRVSAGVAGEPAQVLESSRLNLSASSQNTVAQQLGAMVEKRITDEKSAVRKTALMVLEMLMRLYPDVFFTDRFASHLFSHAKDASVLNRKQAITSIANLLSFAFHSMAANSSGNMEVDGTSRPQKISAELLRKCLTAVLHAVGDSEGTVVDKCLDCVEETVITILANAKATSVHLVVWECLERLNTEGMNQFQRACKNLAKLKRLPSSLIPICQHVITSKGTKAYLSAWVLLQELSEHFPSKISVQVATSFYSSSSSKDMEADSKASGKMRSCLHVLAKTAAHMSQASVRSLMDDLTNRVKTFSASPNVIPSMLKTIDELFRAASSGNERESIQWFKELCETCHTVLRAVAVERKCLNPTSPENFSKIDESCGGLNSSQEEDLLCRVIFTVGDSVLACSGLKVSPGIVNLIQTFAAKSLAPISGGRSREPSPTSDGQPPSHQSGDVILSDPIRAHSWIALGKFSIVEDSVAKRLSKDMAKELVDPECPPAVRNNLLVIMADLCVKYTSLIDPFVGDIANCLKDKNELVRHHALVVLAQLLAEDFIKFKNGLFFKFLLPLIDDCHTVRTFAEYALVHILNAKQPNLFFTNFVETIFAFNNFNFLNSVSVDAKFSEVFGLHGPGPQLRSKRVHIYRTLLTAMSDDQKLRVHQKIHTDILAYIADQTIPLSTSQQGASSSSQQQQQQSGGESSGDNTSAKFADEILSDCLDVLCLKEIKWNTKKSANGSQEDDSVAAAETARAKVISQLEKKNVVENIMPILIELKRLLEAQHSPMLRNLMKYIKQVSKDHKENWAEMFVADRQLMKELEYDLRQLESAKGPKRQSLAPLEFSIPQSPFAGSPNGTMPPPLPLPPASSARRARRSSMMRLSLPAPLITGINLAVATNLESPMRSAPTISAPLIDPIPPPPAGGVVGVSVPINSASAVASPRVPSVTPRRASVMFSPLPDIAAQFCSPRLRPSAKKSARNPEVRTLFSDFTSEGPIVRQNAAAAGGAPIPPPIRQVAFHAEVESRIVDSDGFVAPTRPAARRYSEGGIMTPRKSALAGGGGSSSSLANVDILMLSPDQPPRQWSVTSPAPSKAQKEKQIAMEEETDE